MRLAWIENRTYPVTFGAAPWFDLNATDLRLPLSFYCGYSPAGNLAGLGAEPFGSKLAFGLICQQQPLAVAQASAGSAAKELALTKMVIDTNTALMILTALFAGFAARLIGRSWLVASAIVAMLLSRGRWLSGLGQVSDYYIWGLMLSVWLVFSCYFFKTASRYPFAAIWLALMALGLSFPETHLLFCALALVWLAVFLSPDWGEVGPPSPIRLLGAVDLPVGQAVAVHRRQLLPLAIASGLALMLSLGIYFNQLPSGHAFHWWDLRLLMSWFRELSGPVDIDLSLALVSMLIALVLPSPRRYPLLKVAITLVATALVIVVAASGWCTLATAELPRAQYFNVLLKPAYILAVFEPLLLVLGGLSLALIAGRIYDGLKKLTPAHSESSDSYRSETP